VATGALLHFFNVKEYNIFAWKSFARAFCVIVKTVQLVVQPRANIIQR